MTRSSVLVFVFGFVAATTVLSCKGKQLPHSGENPVYELRGLHAAVPCVGCHGEGTPQKLPTACIDCHDGDRPDPGHNPGQDCYACHVEDGWDIVETTITPTGDTGPIITVPVPTFDHSQLPSTQLCWDCHEADRKDLTHYADKVEPLFSWDCQGCHTATAWYWEPIEHPARVPHAGKASADCLPTAEASWVVGCEGCHPNGTDTFQCFSCHPDSHGGDGGTYQEYQCLGCHVAAEPTDCN